MLLGRHRRCPCRLFRWKALGRQWRPDQSLIGRVACFNRMTVAFKGSLGSQAAPHTISIRRLGKGDQAVLEQLLSLEKKLFKKQDNWGDLLVKEVQRRNTFLLYAEVSPGPVGSEAAGAASEEQPEPHPQPPTQQRQRQKQLPPSRPQQHGGSRTHTQRPGPSTSVSLAGQHPQQQLHVVGYILFTCTGLNAHISKLAVAADWQRRGIARQLVRAAVRAARTERRVLTVSLHVDSANTPALGLYKGEGFQSEALLEDYYCRGRHAHKMRLDLDSTQ